jgi:trehalose-6-phosphate hydrolase
MTDFKNKVVYQIYTKSFKDSKGDGLGDIRGVIEKLDYLKELGIDYIWMTPFFKSPLNDNGYDIADYLSIDPAFGTMEDVDELIAEADKKDMGLMFDMVFNHTSTSHEWFQKALAGDKKYQDYYIFKEGSPDSPPTNWISKFGGNAWKYVQELGKWYLHLYDPTQADLNWDNPEVREEMKNVIRLWKK